MSAHRNVGAAELLSLVAKAKSVILRNKNTKFGRFVFFGNGNLTVVHASPTDPRMAVVQFPTWFELDHPVDLIAMETALKSLKGSEQLRFVFSADTSLGEWAYLVADAANPEQTRRIPCIARDEDFQRYSLMRRPWASERPFPFSAQLTAMRAFRRHAAGPFKIRLERQYSALECENVAWFMKPNVVENTQFSEPATAILGALDGPWSILEWGESDETIFHSTTATVFTYGCRSHDRNSLTSPASQFAQHPFFDAEYIEVTKPLITAVSAAMKNLPDNMCIIDEHRVVGINYDLAVEINAVPHGQKFSKFFACVQGNWFAAIAKIALDAGYNRLHSSRMGSGRCMIPVLVFTNAEHREAIVFACIQCVKSELFEPFFKRCWPDSPEWVDSFVIDDLRLPTEPRGAAPAPKLTGGK